MFQSRYLQPDEIAHCYHQAFRQHELKRLNHHINRVLTEEDPGIHDEAEAALARLETEFFTETRAQWAPVPDEMIPDVTTPEETIDGSGTEH